MLSLVLCKRVSSFSFVVFFPLFISAEVVKQLTDSYFDVSYVLGSLTTIDKLTGKVVSCRLLNWERFQYLN